MLAEHLEHDGRYEVVSVAYCDHALALLRGRQIDLVVVLSVHVPWTMWPSSYSPEWRADLMNGILFLKHLRTLHSPPPVIVVSGNPLVEAREQALANGAFAFISKPVGLAELDRAMLLALHERKAQSTSD